MIAWELLQSKDCSCSELSLSHSKPEEFILVPTHGNEESKLIGLTALAQYFILTIVNVKED